MARWIGIVLALAGVAYAVPSASAASTTTLERTIQDCDGDNLLDEAPGEKYVAPGTSDDADDEDCKKDKSGERPRLSNPQSILNFLQLTDFQVVDEESPARVEFFDTTQRGPFNPFSAAYRPQESLTTQVTEAMVRQARNTTSPVTGEKLKLTMLTGDNADSQQFNETRWFIDILDGTAGGGNPDPEMDLRRGEDRKVDPNSGIPAPGCEATPGSVYDGVRGGGVPRAPDNGYYEPDGEGDGDGYSPRRDQNLEETGRDVTVRDFPKLFERANEPFEAVGLDMPWYSAFGNHDALVQGNSPEAYFGPREAPAATEVSNPVYQAIATGCIKPANSDAFAGLEPFILQAQELLAAGKAPDSQEVQAVVTAAQAYLRGQVAAQNAVIVPPDARRCFVAKDEEFVGAPAPCTTGSWIEQHFRTTGSPPGHGFEFRPGVAKANHDGYYSFSPRPGLRFVVLDTITDECGLGAPGVAAFCSEGSVDNTQFEWLRGELEKAATKGEYVLVFSHHTLRTTRQPTTDETEEPVHYGEWVDRENPGNAQNPSHEKTLEGLFCEHPNVLAHITGHEHNNYVRHHRCAKDDPPPPDADPDLGDFWEVSTAAHIDWSQQARMIELVKDTGEQTTQQSETPTTGVEQPPTGDEQPGGAQQQGDQPQGDAQQLKLDDTTNDGDQSEGKDDQQSSSGDQVQPNDQDSSDGAQMSMVLTILDHAGPANPGSGNASSDVLQLASIGRELSYNDYQGGRFTGGRGSRDDRNLIVPLYRPFPCPSAPDECAPSSQSSGTPETTGQQNNTGEGQTPTTGDESDQGGGDEDQDTTGDDEQNPEDGDQDQQSGGDEQVDAVGESSSVGQRRWLQAQPAF